MIKKIPMLEKYSKFLSFQPFAVEQSFMCIYEHPDTFAISVSVFSPSW